MSALWRFCGGCNDYSAIDAVTCETCGRLLVTTKPPRTNVVVFPQPVESGLGEAA